MANLPCKTLRVLKQRQKKRQFAQFIEFLQRLDDADDNGNTFVLFSDDDDDLWHPECVAAQGSNGCSA